MKDNPRDLENMNGMTHEQKVKFCSILMEKFRIDMDPDNELLPQFYFLYQSALICDEINKQTSDNFKSLHNESFEKFGKLINLTKMELILRGDEIKGMMKRTRDELHDYAGECVETMKSLTDQMKSNQQQLLNSIPSTRHYHFTSSAQAFWHGFSKVGLPVTLIAIFVFILLFKLIS
jgi:hypothetical protein